MNHFSLSRRLILYFSIVIVVTLSLVGIYSYVAASKVLDEQQESRLRQIVGGTVNQTELYLQSYERAGNVLITNDSVKRFLDIDPKDSYSYITYLNAIKRDAIATAFEHFPHMNSIYLLGKHGRYILENNYVAPYYEIDNPRELYDTYADIIQNNSRMHILNMALRPESDRRVITLVRPFRGYSSFDYNGVLAIEINVAELSTLWERIDLGHGGYFFIVDSEGRYIFHPDEDQFGQPVPAFIADSLQGDEGSIIVTDESGAKHMNVWNYSPYSRWKLVVSVPMKELRLPATVVRNVVISVGGFALVLGLLMAFRIAQSITKPIKILKEGMRQTERGNWQMIPKLVRKDEIGSLIQSYNKMVKRLSEMIEKVYKSELERQRAEFQALQLQINPHFLYNTLETINCYAVIKESNEIREIVDAMAFMLRYALHMNLNEITVANELNHVRNYLIILNHRMEHEFEIDVDIASELLLEKMVRFTLQPLIENAFEHGFRKRIAEQHRIRIHAWIDEHDFCMTVEDNGSGISAEKLAEIRSTLLSKQLSNKIPQGRLGDSIGLLNVHRRIQMAQGEQYGLSIDSYPGKGTMVTIRMYLEGRDTFY
ncbi:sensor histidine kinase [Paenibacillus nasutitermitis]|uniref:histidine kinase n=1 Tax=Paenibacillus nasutitermitis TaxID=1652958 RepID=A0A916YQP4_9BACL|nr:sensor histidine kinase [Paenibacillus nasutitermitis]GGD56830.1 histidine kinase [Paenibacillus nasutitermitis]